ncbi:MAG: hypothetical protein F4X65_07220 [Chloroflexi bacterium]|nr:hypothetical protein [Chloroflexota bacterium]
MSVQLRIHFDHHHDGFLTRLGRDLGHALDWVAGPAMSEQQRYNRLKAEVRSDKYGHGVL